jgi:hypothetical protein
MTLFFCQKIFKESYIKGKRIKIDLFFDLVLKIAKGKIFKLKILPFNNSNFLILIYAGLTSGILQSSSGRFPQTVQSPISLFNIGLFVAQVPLNSSPFTIPLILIKIKESPNVTATIINVDQKTPIIY